MIRQVVLAATLLIFGTAASASCARDGHPKAIEGGVVAQARDADYELVASPDALHLYVRGHGRRIDIFEVNARITLLAGKSKQVVALRPVVDRLEAIGRFQVGPGTRAVAVVTRPGKPAATVRFALK